MPLKLIPEGELNTNGSDDKPITNKLKLLPEELLLPQKGTPIFGKGITSQIDPNKFDFQTRTDSDPFEFAAQKQSVGAKLGKGLINTTTGLVFDTLKDASYLLDFNQVKNIVTGKEQEFSNFFADLMDKGKESTKLDVFRTKDSQGFHPESAGWWADAMPSIASSLSFLIPVSVGVKGLGLIGKAVGETRSLQALSKLGLAVEDVKGISGAVLSRYMENTMEGKQTFDQTYQDAIKKGSTEEDAKKIAGDAARNNWYLNSVMLGQDIPEYMTIFKGFKGASKLFGKAGTFAGVTLGEAAEEGYQYATDKETRRNALLSGNLIQDDKISLSDRMREYASDPEFWNSTFLGGLGGAVFEGIAAYKDHKTQNKFDGIFQMHKGVLTGDEEEFNRGSDKQFTNKLIEASGNKDNLSKLYNDLTFIKNNPERIEDQEEQINISKNINRRLEQVEFINNMKTMLDATNMTPEIKGETLSTLINQKAIESRTIDINQKLNKLRLEDQSLLKLQDPSLHDYKISKLYEDGIKDLPKLQKEYKEIVKTNREVSKDLLKSYPKYKTKEELEQSLITTNDSKLKNLLKNQGVELNDLQEARELLGKLNTEEGRKEEQNKINKLKQDKEDLKPKPLVLHHEQTIGDEINANDGTAETKLTSEGVYNAEKLGENVKSLGYTDGLSSPSFRAQETAKIVSSKTGGKIEIIAELSPWDLGNFNLAKDTKPLWDKEAEPFFIKHPNDIKFIDKNNKEWTIGESFNQYKDRTLKGKTIVEQHPDKFVINNSNNIRVWNAFDNSNQQWDTNAEDHYLENKDVNNEDILKNKLSKITKSIEDKTKLNEDPNDINNTKQSGSTDSSDEDSFSGNKKTNIYTTEVGIDDGTKLLYKFTSDHTDEELKGYKLQVVTRTNNSRLYDQLLVEDPKAKEFESNKPNYQGIWTILVDKDNKPVKQDNKYIASTLTTSDRITNKEIIIKDKSEKEIIKELNDFRENLLKQTKDIYLPITGKSKGYAQFEHTKDGLRQRHSIERFAPINEVTLELPTKTVSGEPNRAQLSNGQIAYTGKLYALDKEGRSIDLIPRTLNEQEINILVELIRQRLGINKRINRPSDEIEKLIYFGVPKTINKYTIGIRAGSDILTIGEEELTIEQLQTEEGDTKLRKFLATKYVNANSKKYDLNINEEFNGPIVDNSQTPIKYKSYKEFLLSGEDPMFATDLKAKSEQQFKQQYLNYDPNFKTSDLDNIKEEIKTTPIEDVLDLGDVEELIKTKPKRERKGRQTLDRLERLSKDKTKIEQSEINWFKTTFPNIPIEKVQGLIENKSLGRFISSGKVLLSTEATIGTLKHEAFHTVTQLYLNKEEIKKLYNEAKEKTRVTDRLYLEEAMAEDFVNYTKTGKILNNRIQRNTIFKKLLNFIKDLLNLNATSIEDIYRRLDKGFYTNKHIIGIKEFDKLDSSLPNRNEKFTKDVLDTLDALYFDELFLGDKTPSEINTRISKIIINNINETLIDIEDQATNPIVLDSVGYILDNWELVLSKWIKRAESKGIELELNPKEETNKLEEENLDTENNLEPEEVHTKSDESKFDDANTINTKSTMSMSTKMLIMSLKSTKPNDLGLPTTVDFNSTYNYLLRNLAGLLEYSDIYNKIEELSNFKPELKELLSRLGKSNKEDLAAKFLFQQQFRQSFSKNYNTSLIQITNIDGTTYFIDADKQNTSERIKEQWRNNIRDKSIQNENGKLILNKDIDQLLKLDKYEFLKQIGFNLSKETIEKTKKDNSFKDAVEYLKDFIRGDKKYNTSEIKGNVTKLFDKGKEGSGIESKLQYLFDIEAEHNPEPTELSHQNAEGKTIYSISLNNALSIIKNDINNSKTLEELYEKQPHLNSITAEGSLWLSKLFDKDGNKIEGRIIETSLLDGIQTGTDVKAENQSRDSTRKLSVGDKYVQEFMHILSYGGSSIIRTSDKSQEYTARLSEYGKNQKLAVPIELVKDNFNDSKIREIFQNYFKAEFKRIALFKLKDLGKDIDQYNKYGNKWSIFESILTRDFKSKADEIIENLRQQELSLDDIKSKIDELAPTLYEELNKLLFTNIENKELETRDSFFIRYTKELVNKLNDYNISRGQGLSKDFNYTIEELSRAVTINDFINSIEQTKLFLGDMTFYKDLFKRTAAIVGTKETASTGKEIDEWLNNNLERKDQKLANGEINVQVSEDIKIDLEEELIKYYGMEEADAQGMITLDERRELEYRLGTWNSHKEQAYIKLQDNKTLTKEELEYFTVLKLQYSGPQKYKDLFVPTYHKFALFTLLPNMIKGTNLSLMLDHMTKNQIGYHLFRSGSKVGTKVIEERNKENKQIIRANKFYNEIVHGEINTEKPQIQTIYYKYLGIQTKTSEPHDKVIYGTQFRKLLFGNVFIDGKESFEGASNLLSNYKDITSRIINESKDKLIKDINIDPLTYKTGDVTKLVELLKKEAKERNLADNIIEAFQLNEDKTLKYKFDTMVNKSKIDSMLTSLINSRIIRQKMNGDALIQVASTGFEPIGKREIGINKVLKFYRKDITTNKTLPMEVKLAINDNYKSLFTKYESLDKLNQAIKEGKHKEELQMVGYRIPTQGMNSIDYMQIIEFLPEESSTTIILPTAIVAKSGGDYDVDKLNIFRYTLNDSGMINENNHQNKLINIAKEIISHEHNFNKLVTPNSTKILTDIVDEIRFIGRLNDSEKQKKNPIIFTPETREQVKKNYIESFKESLKNIRYTDQLKLTTKIDQFIKFMLGKDMIGPIAVNNTHLTLSQANNLTLNTSYKDKFGKQQIIKINFDHNLTKDGKINLAALKDVNNNHDIAEVLSQMINAAVDAAKDPFFYDLNMTMETLPIYLYLVRIGVPIETIGMFMKQPIISEYLEVKNINDSNFLKALGKNKKRKTYIQDLKDKYNKNKEPKILTTEELKLYLNIENQSSDDFKAIQTQVLDDYLSYKEQANLLSKAIKATNMDTTGLGKNLDSSRTKLKQIEEVKKTVFINGLDKILKDSIITPFNQHQFAIDTFGQFYNTQEKNFQDHIQNLVIKLNPITDDQRDKITTLITNDLIDYIIQNYGYTNIKDIRDKLLLTDSVAKRLIQLRNKPNKDEFDEKLISNLFVKELYPLLADSKHDTNNIRIYTKRFDKFTADQLTEALREIKIIDAELYKDILDTGIIQSGLNNSPITYLGLIPYEYYNELAKQAFDNFDKKNGVDELYKFDQLFLRNNPTNPLISGILDHPKLGYGIFGKNYNKDKYIELSETQYKKGDTSIEQQLKDSGFIAQYNDKLYIKQHDYYNAIPIIAKFNKQTPGLISIPKVANHTGSKGQFIYEVKINQQLQLQFNKTSEESHPITQESADQLIKDLTDRLGVNVEFTTKDKLEGNVAAYKEGKVYLTRLDLDDTLHEFIHPFLDSLVRNNPELFDTIMKQVINEHSDIYDDVQRLYKNETELMQYKEMAVRAITKLAIDKDLTPKQKTILEKLWQAIKDLISLLYPKQKLDLSTLSPNSTLRDLAKVVTQYKGQIDLKKSINQEQQFKKKEEVKQEEIPFKEQRIFYAREIAKLQKKQSRFKEGSVQYNKIQEQIDKINEPLIEAISRQSEEEFKTLGLQTLTNLEVDIIEKLEKKEKEPTDEDIEHASNIIEAFEEFYGLKDKAEELKRRLFPFINENLLKEVNKNLSKDLTIEEINSQDKDIGRRTGWVGSLSDSPNYIVAAIGSIITKAQNRVEVINKKLKKEIEQEVDNMYTWAKKNGVDPKKMYDIFIQPHKGTTKLAQPYFETGEINPDYEKIQNTPELRRFYEYYKKNIYNMQRHLPSKYGDAYIPSIKKKTTVSILKNLIPSRRTKNGELVISEELKRDIIPTQYHTFMKAEDKSTDLGSILWEFGQYSNNHDEMTEILPKVRLLQKSLIEKQDKNGVISDKEFAKSSNPKESNIGRNTNLYKMTQDTIKMQVLGDMKKEEGKFLERNITDENGNVTGTKYVLVSDVVDLSLKYNSLLRIGFSPITATANILFGDISNLIEASGGRFFNIKDLHNANTNFFKQTLNKDSFLNKLIEELDFLEKLDDYEGIKSGEIKKKFTPEKIAEYAYAMQKGGEKYLQARSALAIIIHDGYSTSKGEPTQKWLDATKEEKEKLANKIHGVNYMIHGRYSQKEASAASQYALFRLMSQFRKWIPAYIESRFDEKKFNQRLGVETEGRYITFKNLILNLNDSITRLKEGKLTDLEKYNMKKNLTEIAMWAILAFSYAALHGGDDEEAKKRRKNSAIKLGLTLLNRAAADLSFFYNPTSVVNIAKTAVPIATTAGTILQAVKYIPSAFSDNAYYKSGSRKGKHKLGSTIERSIPGIKVIDEANRILSEGQLEELE